MLNPAPGEIKFLHSPFEERLAGAVESTEALYLLVLHPGVELRSAEAFCLNGTGALDALADLGQMLGEPAPQRFSFDVHDDVEPVEERRRQPTERPEVEILARLLFREGH